MVTIEEIRKDKEKAEARLDGAVKILDEFMKEENLVKFEKRWGTEAMKEEKKRLVKNMDDWKKQVEEWGETLRKFVSGGEGNEQIV